MNIKKLKAWIGEQDETLAVGIEGNKLTVYHPKALCMTGASVTIGGLPKACKPERKQK